MAFTTLPAPTAAAQRRVDIAYDVRSSETLISEFEQREAQIRGKS